MSETMEYKGYTIRIEQDTDPMNPRTESEPMCVMICMHQRYNLGDEHSYKADDFKGWDELLEKIEEDYGPLAVVKKLYLYDHSGLTIRTRGFGDCDSMGWDWGQVGYAFITREVALHEYGAKKLWKSVVERAEKYLDGEVKTYDEYLKGDVYGYVIEKDDDDNVASCWGYFGDDFEASGLLEGARDEIDSLIRQMEKQAAKDEFVLKTGMVPT